VLRYCVEATSTHADKLLKDTAFIHRQTMASAMRFTTVALGDLEQRIASAADKALALELAMFDDLVGEVTRRSVGSRGPIPGDARCDDGARRSRGC
jgi:DNA mismatch repair protein MutS